MTINNKEINILIQRKHSLIRQYERKDLDDETYTKEMKEVEKEIKEKNKVVINDYYGLQEEKKMTEDIKEEQKVEKEQPKKIGKKTQSDSYASAIGKALEMKTIKNVNDVVDKVLEMKPGRDKTKLKSQVSAIIREAKAEKGRWKSYTWNQEEFLLIPKE